MSALDRGARKEAKMASRSNGTAKQASTTPSPIEEHEAFLAEHDERMRRVDEALDALDELVGEEQHAPPAKKREHAPA